MIEQFYAVHKKTGEFFNNKGRYCFTHGGLIQSLRNQQNWDEWDNKWSTKEIRYWRDYEIRKVELT